MTVASFLAEDIASPSHINLILLLMTLSSAMVDTMTLPLLKVFVANNTGNLLLLGLGAAGVSKEYPELVFPDRAAVALVSSWGGSFVTGHVMRAFGTRRRAWVVGHFAFEAIIIFVGTIILYTGSISVTGSTSLIEIWLLAWVFGSQGVATKTLGVPTITVQVVTGAMGDLFSDPKLFAFPLSANKPRNERAAFIVCFFVGSVFGGLMLVRVNGQLVLLLVAIIKLICALAFLFIPAKKATPKNTLEDGGPPVAK